MLRLASVVVYFLILGVCAAEQPTNTTSAATSDGVCSWDRLAEFELIVSRRCSDTFYPQYCPRAKPQLGGPIRRQCSSSPLNVENNGIVELVNSTFDEFLSDSRGRFPCVLVAFYSRFCPFSARLAPWYNALPVYYPQLLVAAVEVNDFAGHNARYGITGTPTVLLFYHEKPAARYNFTLYSLELLKSFLDAHTNLVQKDIQLSTLPDSQLYSPLPTHPEEFHDIWLTLSWLFLGCAAVYYGLVVGYLRTWARALWSVLLRRRG